MDTSAASSGVGWIPQQTLLENITLNNFRSFSSFEIQFHPRLTVLVARNGIGKTALLDACALASRYFVDNMLGASTSPGFAKGDIRRSRTDTNQMVDQLPVSFFVDGRIDGQSVRWGRVLAGPSGKSSAAEAKAVKVLAASLLRRLRVQADKRGGAPPDLPVMAYYGTGRLWSEGRQTKAKARTAQQLDVQVDAYRDCLDPRSSFHAFATWFEQVCREAQRRTETGEPAAPRAQGYIEAVRAATSHLLAPSGWGRLDWSFVSSCIVAEHPDTGELPVDRLSDGVRNTLGLVADLAHRCVRLNPHLGAEAPRRTSGVVLIDEVDMHLHPGWQQRVVPALREAFPLVQFIVSTHSPLVLSTVPRECIRVLDLGPDGVAAALPVEQTEGVTAPEVLSAVMLVDPAPDVPIRHALHRYRALIQDRVHESEEGAALRAQLNQHFGAQHPAILDLERLIRFRRVVAPRVEPAPRPETPPRSEPA